MLAWPQPGLADPADEGQARASMNRPQARVELDSDMKKVLDALVALKPLPIASLTPEQARKQPSAADAVMKVLKDRGKTTAPEKVANVEDRVIVAESGRLPVRIYTPKGDAPFPVVVYFHGGGWVVASNDTYDASARALTNAAKSIVLAVEYRKAPEHKFPAQIQDAFAAYQWTLRNAQSIGGDPTKVAVAGESAGGNLAAVVSMMARDKNLQLPSHQLLVYPVTNYAFDTPSYTENAQAKPLDRDGMKWFWKQYLRSEQDGQKPYASPLRAKNLAGLPSATIITAEVDPLRSEGQAYAARLKDALETAGEDLKSAFAR